jgi:hypothetical protein
MPVADDDSLHSLRRFFLALCFRLLRRLSRWLFALFIGIDGVQHVMVEAVAAVIAALSKIEIDFGTLRQPKSRIFIGERNRSVLDDQVLAKELNFGHRFH